MTSRLVILGAVFTAMFFGLIVKLFRMQILDGASYQSSYMQRTEQETTTPGTRGIIYDRNGYALAYNKLAYNVVIRDVGAYPNTKDRNAMLVRLVTILQERGENVEGKFEIAQNADGQMVFTSTSDAAKRRFFLNFYGRSTTKELDDNGKYSTKITAREAFELKKKEYKLDEDLSDQTALSVINIIFTMGLTRYQKYEATTVASNVSLETMAQINENIADLQGVEVERSSIREYSDSLYFAPIIGYTGKIQEDQMADLNSQWREAEHIASDSEAAKYNLNDVVGRTGIEQSMELELQGEKGYTKMYVDSMGRPREVIEKTDPQAGHDVYLTIDHDLQVGIYNLIEQQLAGILAQKLRNEEPQPNQRVDASKRTIPIKDAYYQLINNNVLSLDDMGAEDADPIEQQIYSIYQSSKNQILESIRTQLASDHATPMNQLSEDMNTYMTYIYTWLRSAEIVQRDKIDQSTDVYKQWAAGTISLRDYLYSGIADNWVDTTKLDVTSKYSDADDIFSTMTDYIIENLTTDQEFTKKIFRYLINNNTITGRQLCLALYAQGVLADDPAEIAMLNSSGEEYAFRFMVRKVSNIEITPAQLALDPCTAGVTVTDVRTGEVLALVTYPSYDNNQMSGYVDATYYAQLTSDQSNPLYNNVTQARKAPGSTFKPITAIAGLETGVLKPDDVITESGPFDKVDPPIRCWIYPGHHGPETVLEGIQNSCNYFFAEIAHRLSTRLDGSYNQEQGLKAIREYATMFGLDHTSGVELPENAPQLTDTDPERSAIGQGTHQYTNAQLARYVTALANRGTVYELSLLDKITDSDGGLIEDCTPQVHSQINIQESTWNLVQEGMHRVITQGSARSVFSDLSLSIAGKTGTAQENAYRANHAFFISFAPYENPEIAVTVNIPYGYAGTNAALLGKRVYEFYYGYRTLDDVMGSGALGTSNVVIGD